ncbi:MAG: hypothetical protein AB7P07_10310 [Hyphomonadaceae bacterium]
MRLVVLTLAALLGLAAPAAAEWSLIGEREVLDRVDRDTIVVEGHQRYERIRLCVARNPVHFLDLDIRYHNGAEQDVPVRARINAGQCTRVIDLVGEDRDIATISILYEETSRGRGRAHVRVFAE